MAAKLSRYVFRRINGRIIPIRKGVDESVVKSAKNVSSKALKRLNLLMKSNKVKLTKAGNLKKVNNEYSGTDYMIDFMKKTGSARVSKSGNSMISISSERALTASQKKTFIDMGSDVKSIYTENEEVFRLSDAFRISQGKKPVPDTKLSKSLLDKAKKYFGITHNANTAGYITPDGKMLDFSGGGGFERWEDHRGVSAIMNRPPLKKLKDSDISRILRDEQSSRKGIASKPHAHWKYLNNIKHLKKTDIVTGKDRGELIKDNIRYIRADKRHLLKKLKNKRRKQ